HDISHSYLCYLLSFFFFFFYCTPAPDIFPPSLPDALPISRTPAASNGGELLIVQHKAHPAVPGWSTCSTRLTNLGQRDEPCVGRDRKSTRLNSSHLVISYAVFCLKKKNTQTSQTENCKIRQ